MKAGELPGGDTCHGHHVWDEDECLRCGRIDYFYFNPRPQPSDPSTREVD